MKSWIGPALAVLALVFITSRLNGYKAHNDSVEARKTLIHQAAEKKGLSPEVLASIDAQLEQEKQSSPLKPATEKMGSGAQLIWQGFADLLGFSSPVSTPPSPSASNPLAQVMSTTSLFNIQQNQQALKTPDFDPTFTPEAVFKDPSKFEDGHCQYTIHFPQSPQTVNGGHVPGGGAKDLYSFVAYQDEPHHAEFSTQCTDLSAPVKNHRGYFDALTTPKAPLSVIEKTSLTYQGYPAEQWLSYNPDTQQAILTREVLKGNKSISVQFSLTMPKSPNSMATLPAVGQAYLNTLDLTDTATQ